MMLKKAAAAVLAVFCIAAFISCGKTTDNMSVDILSTGDSDCIIISDGSHTVLIDTADSDDYKKIYSHLTDQGVSVIDAIILTHYDNDHIGSASDIVRDFTVSAIYGPNYSRSSSNAKKLDKEADKKGTPITKLKNDTVLQFGDMTFGISVPALEEYADENDYSLIISLSHGKKHFLFMGDACKERLGEFNLTSIGTRYDVVKFPHHGDYFKAIKYFVQFNQLSFGVSCVRNESYIDSRLNELISLAGAKPLSTANGEICFISDGNTVTYTQ